MRANVARGELKSPPPSYEWAVKRLKQVKLQLEKIDKQLKTVTPESPCVLGVGYDKWLESARKAQECYQIEADKTEEWIAANEPTLFLQAYELLRDLEMDVDLEPEEVALIRKLDDHFVKEKLKEMMAKKEAS